MFKFFKPKHTQEVNGFCDIDTPEMLKLFDTHQSEYVWLDVRTPKEYNAGHIPGAKHIPIDEIEDRLKEVGAPDQNFIVYCHSGGRSKAVCEFLNEKGFKHLWNYTGGMSHWSGPTE